MNCIAPRSIQPTLHRFTSLGLALLLAFMSSLALVQPAKAQPSDADLGEVNIWLALFPQLRVLPAPPVIQLGTRITYEARSAILGGGGAGAGISQADIVALGATTFAQVTNYGDNGAGLLIPLGSNPSLALPAVGQFWIHPSVLVNAENVANPNLSVTRSARTINGAAVNVVRFQTDLNGARHVYEFSVNSGILVFSSISVPGAGTSQESQLILLNVRQLNLASLLGAAAGTASTAQAGSQTGYRAPNWVRPDITMEFTGQRLTTLPGGSPFASPYGTVAQITDATPNWSVIQATEYLNGTNVGSGLLITGIGQVYSPYWLPRAVLNSSITSRVLLDTDLYTGIQLTMERDPNGDIILRQFAQAFQTAHRYNAALGSLDGAYLYIESPAQIMETSVVRTGGSNLLAANQLPELPDEVSPPQSTYIPLVMR